MHQALYRALLYLIAGWSGFFVMGVELLGGRLLAPLLRQQHLCLGRDHHGVHAGAVARLSGGRPRLAAAPEPEAAGADPAGRGGQLTLPVLLFGDALLECISTPIADPRFGSLLARSAAVLCCRPLVSGMVSPYAVRLLVADRRSAGQHAGKLYFVSTFGSAAGHTADLVLPGAVSRGEPDPAV